MLRIRTMKVRGSAKAEALKRERVKEIEFRYILAEMKREYEEYKKSLT